MSKIIVKGRGNNDNRMLSGRNVEIFIDDKKLKGVFDFSMHVNAKDVAEFTIKMYADFLLEANIDDNQLKFEQLDGKTK